MGIILTLKTIQNTASRMQCLHFTSRTTTCSGSICHVWRERVSASRRKHFTQRVKNVILTTTPTHGKLE